MSTADTNNIGIKLQAAGENLNTWGDPNLNNDLIVLSNLCSKFKSIAISGDYTVAETNYSTTNDTEVAMIKLTAGTVAAAFSFIMPGRAKRIVLWNTSGFTVTPRLAATAGFALPNNGIAIIGTDGTTDVYNMSPNYGGVSSPTVGGQIPNWTAVQTAIATAGLPATAGTFLNSGTDTAAGYGSQKVVAYGLLQASTGNPAANEVLNLKPITTTATGTDTYAITPSPAITAYAAGNAFSVLFTNANTGAATLNVSGLGAKAITKNGATALASGDIPAACVKLCTYDGTQFQIVPTFIPDDGQAALYNSIFAL